MAGNNITMDGVLATFKSLKSNKEAASFLRQQLKQIPDTKDHRNQGIQALLLTVDDDFLKRDSTDLGNSPVHAFEGMQAF